MDGNYSKKTSCDHYVPFFHTFKIVYDSAFVNFDGYM